MNMSCLIILKKILSYFPKKMLMELDRIGWNWMIPCLENPRWALPIEATTLLRFGRSTFPLRFRIVKRCHGASFLRAQRNFIRKTKENIQKLCLRLESANLLNVWCLGWNFSFAMLCWSVGCQKKRPYMPPIDPAAFKGKSGRKMSEAGPNPHFCLQLL